MKYLSISILFVTTLFAQAPEMEYNKGYGTDLGEHIHEIMQTSDGGYAILGTTINQGNSMLTLFKTKSDGTIGVVD